MEPNTSTDFKFTYPRHAREFPQRQSPLLHWYGGATPPGCVISHGVVTSDNVKHDAT